MNRSPVEAVPSARAWIEHRRSHSLDRLSTVNETNIEYGTSPVTQNCHAIGKWETESKVGIFALRSASIRRSSFFRDITCQINSDE